MQGLHIMFAVGGVFTHSVVGRYPFTRAGTGQSLLGQPDGSLAWKFDGNGAVTMDAGTSFSVTGNDKDPKGVTVCVRGIRNVDSGGFERWAAYASSASVGATQWIIQVTNADVFQFSAPSSGNKFQQSSTTVTVGKKYDVVGRVTIGKTSQPEIFVDGLAETNGGTTATGAALQTSGGFYVNLGGIATTYAGEKTLWDLRVYNRALSDAEVYAYTDNPYAGFVETGRVAYFIPDAAPPGGATIPIFRQHYANMAQR